MAIKGFGLAQTYGYTWEASKWKGMSDFCGLKEKGLGTVVKILAVLWSGNMCLISDNVIDKTHNSPYL